ncbi:MAG: hypothetical protein WBF17_20465 [Phycisphaerae bacterium]
MSTRNGTALLVGAVCMACLVGGCNPGPFNVEILLDERDRGLQDKIGAVQSIEVNFVGVSDTDYRRWEQMSMNGFWEPDNKIRTSAIKYVMRFGEGHPKKQILSLKDPIWREWIDKRQANHLFVLAYLPWLQEDSPGDADPRRKILPLERGRWEWSAWGALTIPIELRATGMTLLRQPNKKK